MRNEGWVDTKLFRILFSLWQHYLISMHYLFPYLHWCPPMSSGTCEWHISRAWRCQSKATHFPVHRNCTTLADWCTNTTEYTGINIDCTGEWYSNSPQNFPITKLWAKVPKYQSTQVNDNLILWERVSEVTSWLLRSSPDRAVWVRAPAREGL